jgi:hypothetical protein
MVEIIESAEAMHDLKQFSSLTRSAALTRDPELKKMKKPNG